MTNLPMIVDSHIHLYAEAHLSSLNWTAGLPSDHILNRQSSVEQYTHSIKYDFSVRGFVFVETDRKSDLKESGWQDSLDEISFVSRIAQGVPIEGEGHVSADSKYVLGMVPWAPMPLGPSGLERYVARVKEACGDEHTFSRVKGFRYLLQDKPLQTMTQSDFILGLQWLGENGFVFDLGIDSRSGGLHQLQEALEMLERVYAADNKLKVVANHLCKPNLRLRPHDIEQHTEFITWKKHIEAFSRYSTVYIKLSGLFSELPPQDTDSPTSIPNLIEQVKPWVDVVFRTFGPSRIMFGSDWPVCTAGGPGQKSWQHWFDLVTAILDEQGLTSAQKGRVWSGTAVEAYDLDVSI